MYKSYFKVAIRNLTKQKIYTAINLVGLTICLAACLFIALYVTHELSYDRFNPKADRIFKMVLERRYPNHSTLYSRVPSSFASVAKNDIPEIKNMLRFTGPWDEATFTYRASDNDVRVFYNNLLIQADTSFFSFFPVRFLRGNPKTALTGPNQLVITEHFAKKMFKDEDPLDKTIDGGNFGLFKITGVCESLPANSHLKFDVVGSLLTDPYYFVKDNNYTAFYTHTYFELYPETDPAQVESKFPKMVDTYASGEIERELKMSWGDYKKAGNGYRYFLQPLTSIHLDPNFELTFTSSGNFKYIYALLLIGLLILAITCINYVNLATARSSERAREVGIRKIIGSSKGQLVFQFLAESLTLSFVATLLSIVIFVLLLRSFNSLIEQQLAMDFSPVLIGGLLLVSGTIGVLSGLYPAFVLSAHKPILIVKGGFARNSSSLWLRNSLVSIQFIVATVLMACTIVIKQQINFMQTTDIGFEKNHVVIVDWAYALKNNLTPYLNYLKGLEEVESVGGVGAYLGDREWDSMRLQPEESNDVLTVKFMLMDDDFATTIGFKFKEGRAFSEKFNDSLSIILNEAAVRTLGMKNPIGQKLINTTTKEDGTLDVSHYTIVGIVKDFNFQPLHDQITPLAIVSSDTYGGFYPSLAVRLRGKNMSSGIQKMEAKWKELVPDKLFRYGFLEERMGHQYAEEQRSEKLFVIFSAIALVIGCVGIFGLAMYTVSSRAKELSIRKVLGASLGNLIMLLTENFVKLIVIAISISVPISWWTMNKWLQGFAYRIDSDWEAFFLASSVTLLIPLIVVGYQSVKTSRINPIKSLKSE